MRAIVTGAAGFIGQHLVSRLTWEGHEVLGIDRRYSPGGAVLDLADRRNQRRLASLIGGADAIFHLAGRPGVRDSCENIDEIRERDNVIATRHLLEVVSYQHVIAASSSSVYGGAPIVGGQARPCSESDPINALGGYARSKAAMEMVCAEFAARGTRIAVVRPFTVAGEDQRPDMAIATWINAIRSGRGVDIYGSPDRTRDITDVRDVVEGLMRIQQRGFEGILNMGTGQGHRLIEILEAVFAALKIPGTIRLAEVSSEDPYATLADTRRCDQALDFAPETDLGGLVRRQVAHTTMTNSREVLN